MVVIWNFIAMNISWFSKITILAPSGRYVTFSLLAYFKGIYEKASIMCPPSCSFKEESDLKEVVAHQWERYKP